VAEVEGEEDEAEEDKTQAKDVEPFNHEN